tara:strand:+ start:308 stop:550 length:243 start_codon:yes stop_codon:yes gene_type:complete
MTKLLMSYTIIGHKNCRGVERMTYILAQLNFVKVDDEGNEETDSKGNVITYVPKGRWKELEYLCEDRNDDDFEVEKTDES